jgi:hypothetical protein
MLISSDINIKVAFLPLRYLLAQYTNLSARTVLPA